MEELNRLKAALEAVQEQLAAQQESIAKLRHENEAKDAEIARLNEILRNMQRARFGQRSEKSRYILGDESHQISIFEQIEQDIKADIAEIDSEKSDTGTDADGDSTDAEDDLFAMSEATVEVSGHKRKRKRTLEELCAGLPEEVRVIDLPEEEKYNSDGKPLERIGREFVRREVIREKANIKVICYYRNVYVDRDTEKQTGESLISKPEMPAPLLPHSYVSASLVTEIIVRKYADGLPLYRQEQMWRREGFPLQRGTMANWIIEIAERYFSIIWQALKEELLRQAVIHADETELQVLKEPGRNPSSESRMWVYASSRRANAQVRIFEYQETRSGDHAAAFLKGYCGIVISDGFSGYDKLKNVTRGGCWAHARRAWRDALPEGATLENSKAAQGIQFCDRLFRMEKLYADRSDEERMKLREKRAARLLNEYWAWLDTIKRPTGKLEDAVHYSLNQKEYLTAFLKHGEMDISNSQAENAIRPFVVGRKNWLFSDTPAGAKASAILYTMMETAKANQLNVEKYLQHLLTVLPERFKSRKNPVIDDLMPWSDGIKAEFTLGY